MPFSGKPRLGPIAVPAIILLRRFRSWGALPGSTGSCLWSGAVLQRYHPRYRGGTAISDPFRAWRITESPGQGPGRYCGKRPIFLLSGSEKASSEAHFDDIT